MWKEVREVGGGEGRWRLDKLYTDCVPAVHVTSIQP